MFYGLIQFRNYQANNFNILFLAFSCNILKKHFSPLGERHIQKIVDLVYRNFDQKEKSDEYEMFLGKSGKNKLEGREDLLDMYKFHINRMSPQNKLSGVLVTENIENYMATCIEFLEENYSKVLTNLSLLELNGELARCVCLLNQNKLNESLMVVSNLNEKIKYCTTDQSHYNFAIATSICCIGEALAESNGSMDLAGVRVKAFTDTLNSYLLTIKSQSNRNFHIFKQAPFENMDVTKGKAICLFIYLIL